MQIVHFDNVFLLVFVFCLLMYSSVSLNYASVSCNDVD